jgi:hypothetical protein
MTWSNEKDTLRDLLDDGVAVFEGDSSRGRPMLSSFSMRCCVYVLGVVAGVDGVDRSDPMCSMSEPDELRDVEEPLSIASWSMQMECTCARGRVGVTGGSGQVAENRMYS